MLIFILENKGKKEEVSKTEPKKAAPESFDPCTFLLLHHILTL